MKNYYFVAPSLPPLVLGESPEISFPYLARRLELNLGKKDLEKVAVLRRAIDLANIRALYSAQPIEPMGNLSEKELDEALLLEADLPDYVFDFLGQFEDTKDKARHFSGLLAHYFAEETQRQKGFLQELLQFQRQLYLVLTALRAKRLKRDILQELQFEDFSDPIVAQILAQKEMDDYEPPLEFQELKQNLQALGDQPWKQFEVVSRFEFEKIEEMSGYPLFSIDWILGYVARFLLVEKWDALDGEMGSKIIDGYRTGT